MAFKLLVLLAAFCPAAQGGQNVLTHPYAQLPVSTAAVEGAIPGLVKGETLEYEIYWGAVRVGRAFLRAEGPVLISSRPAWHLVSEVRSTAFINNFYKVEDRNDAWMDVADLRSYGYYKKISEGRYFINEWAVFDRDAARFFGMKLNRKQELAGFEGPLPKPVNDMLSAVYRVRSLKLEPGGKIEMDVNSKRNWTVAVKAGKREKVETDYGKKKCIILEPMAGEEGLFVAKAGKRMLIWVTDDELKVPMILKAEIFIGSITAKLVRRTIAP